MTTTMNQAINEFLPPSLTELALPAEFVLPAFEGQSILNVPSSICELFNLPLIHSNPLRDEILSPVKGDIKRVIVVLIDALAMHRFSNWLQEGDLPVWKELLKSGTLNTLTSITPSTTCAALTTLWTGHSTAEHGVGGYELWLKQYGLVANMITQSPMSYRNGGASLDKAGFNPETVLAIPKLGSHLVTHGVAVNAFQHYTLANSGLSRTFMDDVNVFPFGTEAECWVNLREQIENRKNDKLYFWAYWGAYDHLAHVYGPDDERARLFFMNFNHSLEQDFLMRLSPELRKGTLLVLTADHGQIRIDPDPVFDLVNHPEFLNCLHIKPTGEGRLTYLHLKPGKEETLREYASAAWPDQFVIKRSSELLDAGFFGPGTPMQDIHNRLGDLTMIAKGKSYLWWSDEENPLKGRHGGLTPDEMLVPLAAVRL